MNDPLVQNQGDVEKQANVGTNNGTIVIGSNITRLAARFQRLHEEIGKHVKGEVLDDLLYYNTVLDGSKGFEVKMADGGFSPSFIERARIQKEMYAKKAQRFSDYPSAQQINLDFFAKIKTEFDLNIYPLIVDGLDTVTIMKEIHNVIVKPIMDLLNAEGAYDEDLQYTEDHIYGMIYYLTGMCHLNWKDYDNV